MFDFLILGAGRSGTSLLAALVDRHPQLEVAFELGGHEYLRGRALEEEPERLLEQRIESFLDACNAAAKHSPAPHWGNKITTEQLAGLNRHNLYTQPPVNVLDRCFNDYLAGKRIVYLLRDGRACVASKLSRTPQSLEQACKSWCYAIEVLEFLRSSGLPLLEIRFEQLLAEPENALQVVHGFLGVSPEPLDPRATDHPAMPAAYRQGGIDPSRSRAPGEDHPSVPLIRRELELTGYL